MSWTGFRIWIFAVLLNGLFIGLWAAFKDEAILSFVLALGFAFGGIFVTAPILVVVLALVNVSRKLPYNINARIIWLWIMLSLMGFIMIIGGQAIITRNLLNFKDELVNGLMISVSISIGLAVLFEKAALKRFFSQES